MTAPDPTRELTEKLRECPFCGGVGHFARVGRSMEVLCQSCGSAGPLSDDRASARAAWNRRADDRLLSEKEALEKELAGPLAAKYLQLIPDDVELMHGARHPDDMADDDLALVALPIGLFRTARRASHAGGGDGN